MRRCPTWLVALALLCLAQGAGSDHTPLPAGMSETEAAWLWGYHTIPASITRDDSPYWYHYAHSTDVNKIDNPSWTEVAAGHIEPGARAPAVLVLHGCSGLMPSPNAYRVFFVEQGFAVFEPNSFARPGHSCETSSTAERIEELEYAYQTMLELPWVDRDRIVLMGISQGGRAVARWDRPGFAAHIILANDCEGGQPHAPPGVPVLAVVGEEDEYFDGSSCKVSRQNNGSRSIIIPHAPHDIIDYPETEQAMLELLRTSGLLDPELVGIPRTN